MDARQDGDAHPQTGDLGTLDTAAKNAHLAQIISPEIKLSTEAIFYY